MAFYKNRLIFIYFFVFISIAIFVFFLINKNASSSQEHENCIQDQMASIATIYSYDKNGDLLSMASGFIYKLGDENNGMIGTNYHVISNVKTTNKILVRFNNGRIVQAKVYSYDLNMDLALVHANTNAASAPVIKFSNNKNLSKIGDKVYSISSPRNLINTITEGVLSGTHRPSIYSPKEDLSEEKKKDTNDDIVDTADIAIIDAMQTDAIISDGSSGGLVFKENCEALGVIFAEQSDQINQESLAGLNFLIPNYTVNRVLKFLENREKVLHGSLGLVLSESTNTVDSFFQGKNFVLASNGALVNKVDNNNLGKDLKAGDIIVNFNGENVNDQYQLLAFIFSSDPGSKVTIKYYRPTDNLEIKSIDVVISSSFHDIAK